MVVMEAADGAALSHAVADVAWVDAGGACLLAASAGPFVAVFSLQRWVAPGLKSRIVWPCQYQSVTALLSKALADYAALLQVC